MIVPTMTRKELTREIIQDYEIIVNSSTLDRFYKAYYRERTCRKIKKEDEYTVFYEIKTKSKNNWILRYSKDKAYDKYQSMADGIVMCFTYYHDEEKIRLFSTTPKGEIAVFNTHLFDRYKERMELDLEEPMDIVKHFLKHNFVISYNVLPEEKGRVKAFGVVTDGFLMGLYIARAGWWLNKTFISRKTNNLMTGKFELMFIISIQQQLQTIDMNKYPEQYLQLARLYRTLVPPKPTDSVGSGNMIVG